MVFGEPNLFSENCSASWLPRSGGHAPAMAIFAKAAPTQTATLPGSPKAARARALSKHFSPSPLRRVRLVA